MEKVSNKASPHPYPIDNDLNDDEDSDSVCNNKMNPNSLISISKEVFSFLKEKTESKGSNVTEYILRHLKKSQTNLSFKNIQRRVYDAINVMNAVGIIRKDKNILVFKGKMNFTEGIKTGKTKPNDLKSLKEKIKLKRSSINNKQHELVGLCSKVV